MSIVKRFLIANLLWAGAIMLLVIPISLATANGLTYIHHLRWLAHSIALAALPAGLTVGGAVFRRGRTVRNLIVLSGAELLVMAVVLGLLVYSAGADDMNLFGLLMRDSVVEDIGGWRVWNQLVWPMYITAAEAVSVPIYAGLGIMVGAWSEQMLPQTVRRIIYWGLSMAMIAATYLITENSYEMLVLKTSGPAAFSAFFMLLIPFGMYVGLMLPSISLAQRAQAE
jgi:hypothetical protein